MWSCVVVYSTVPNGVIRLSHCNSHASRLSQTKSKAVSTLAYIRPRACIRSVHTAQYRRSSAVLGALAPASSILAGAIQYVGIVWHIHVRGRGH